LLRLGLICQRLDIVPAANTRKRNQPTSVPANVPNPKRQKITNYEDKVTESAHDATKSGGQSNNETSPPTTHSVVYFADEALPKAIVRRDYHAVDEEEIDLSVGEYLNNITYPDREYWSGTNERGDTGLFPCDHVRIINVNFHHKSEEEATFRFLDLPGGQHVLPTQLIMCC